MKALFLHSLIGIGVAFSQDVTIETTTDRVACQPGQKIEISVTGKNTGDAPVTARLTIDIHCDIDTRFQIVNEPVTFAPGQRFKKSIEWQTPNDELWGCDVTARLIAEEREIAIDRQVFLVSDNLVKAAANLVGISPGYFKSGRADPVAYAYEKFHDFGIPVVHISCWAPSNWGTIYPKTDSWICAQMRYRVSFDDVDLMVRHAKKRGMFTITYGRVTLEGTEGYRWAKANPDKVWYRNPNGKLKDFPPDALKEWENAEANPKVSATELRKLKRWTMIPRLNDDSVLDDGIDQYVRAIKRFGFDCIRWDWHPGYFYQPHLNWLLQIGSGGAVHTRYYDGKGRLDISDDPDAENVRIIQRWKRRMKEALPNLVLGYNLQVANSVYPDNDEINPQPTRAYSEMVRDSLIIDEKHFVSFSKDRPAGMHRNWARTLNFWHKGSQMVRRYGMCEKLGPLTFGSNDSQVFLGRDIYKDRDYSETIAIEIDTEIRAFVDQCHGRAREILEMHNDQLDALVEALLEREVLSASAVLDILEACESDEGYTTRVKEDRAKRDLEYFNGNGDGDEKPEASEETNGSSNADDGSGEDGSQEESPSEESSPEDETRDAVVSTSDEAESDETKTDSTSAS